MTTPSVISILQPPNSAFLIQVLSKTGVIYCFATHIHSPPHDNHQSRRKTSFCRPHPPSLMTTAATPAPTMYLRNRRSMIGAWVIRSRPESFTTTRPEPLPPSFFDPMDFIGSCEPRWKRNEVAESNKETAGDGLK